MTRPSAWPRRSRLTWRWLCQVAVAPYSYDWIDNRGRRSPQELTPGADRLELGQTMALVFRLVSFERRTLVDRHHRPAWRAALRPGGDDLRRRARPAGSRIVCRLAVPGAGRVRRAKAYALAWGDLVMMRRQLLNLKALAERDARV